MNEKQEKKTHILVIDDDRRIRDLVSRYLTEQGFIVISAESAEAANIILANYVFDILVVDIMMPGQTGVEFTKSLRQRNIYTPVLLLTALGEVSDKISGFDSGADDYLVKPFEPVELVLRLKSILKRTKVLDDSDIQTYKIGRWIFNPDYDELESDAETVRLTSVEANLLRALAHSGGQVVSREDLALRSGMDAGERTIDVQVTRLRRKLEENTKNPRYLQTVRGKGYLLRADKF